MNPLFNTLLQATKKLLLVIAFVLLLPLNALIFVVAPIFVRLFTRNRSLWKGYLRTVAKLRLKRTMGIAPAILLAFEQKDEWSRVVPLIEELNSETERMKMAGSFATLYLWNERLTEARAATDYWLQIANEWVKEHPAEAIAAARIYQQTLLWYPYGFPTIYPADILDLESMGLSRMKREAKALAQAKALDQGMVLGWHEARLVSEFVDWLSGKSLTGEALWKCPPRKEESSPFLMGYDSVHFPRFFVASAGITPSEFKRMWRKASSLDDIQPAV